MPEPGPRFQALAAHFPNRTEALLVALDRFSASLSRQTPDRRATLLRLVFQDLTKTVSNPGVLTKAAELLSNALAEFTRESMAALLRASAPKINRPPPTDEAITLEYELARQPAFEVLAGIYLAAGQEPEAERSARDALVHTPGSPGANLVLARIAARRARDRDALTHYLVASIESTLSAGDDAAMRALLERLHGASADLERARDEAYREKLGTPVVPAPFVRSATAPARVAVFELFTGSGCGPCIAADLAFDALLARYPADALAPVAFHQHVPQPDPMTITGGRARYAEYKVSGVPHARVDGEVARHGAGPRMLTQSVYDSYVTAIDRALGQPAEAAIALQAVLDAGRVHVEASVTGIRAGARTPRLVLVLVEKELRYAGENDIRFHPMVARAVSTHVLGPSGAPVVYDFDLAAAAQDAVKSLADDIAVRQRTAPASTPPRRYRAEGRTLPLDPTALVVIAFVQDQGSHVLQAARVNVGSR